MGFVHFRLSAGVHFGCPLPGTLRFPLAEQCHLLDRVPPSRFLTALTASSTRVLRACCIPHPTMRFAAFPSHVASTTLRRSCASPRLPRDAHTLRRIPLASSRTASPRPLPSCRFRSLRTPLCGGSRLRTLPTLVGVCAPPSPGEPGSGYLALRRSGSLGGPPPAPPERFGLGPAFASTCRSRPWLGHAFASARLGALGLGLSSPCPAGAARVRACSGLRPEIPPSLEAGASGFAHAQSLARRSGLAGWRLHTVSRRRRQRGSKLPAPGAAMTPRCQAHEAPSCSPAASAGAVSRPKPLDDDPSAKPLVTALHLPANAGSCAAIRTLHHPGVAGSQASRDSRLPRWALASPGSQVQGQARGPGHARPWVRLRP
jgi:hypothetical protein